MGAGMTPRQWWRRAAAAVKDKRSLCLARLGPLSGRRSRVIGDGSGADSIRHYPDLEAAVVKATSHDESRMDYKNAGRVFAWARTSPATFLRPLMWALNRRVEKTHSWAVALKALMVTHGVLLCCGATSAAVGRLPFDLSGFHDRFSWGLSAFVRAYFNFLDQRFMFHASVPREEGEEEPAATAGEKEALRKVERMQDLLELLMQVRPYGDEGARARLLLEAMDCVVVEIFEVYSAVCSGIACVLVGIFGPCSSAPSSSRSSSSSSSSSHLKRCSKEEGAKGIRVLRRAAEQSSQLSSYFELCRGLGVLNAAELPPVERIPEQDIEDLESLLLFGEGGPPGREDKEDREGSRGAGSSPGRGRRGSGGSGGDKEEVVMVAASEEGEQKRLGTVVTEDWVVFEEEPATAGRVGRAGSAALAATAFCRSCSDPLVVGSKNGLWELMMYHKPGQQSACGGSAGLGRQCGPQSLVPWKCGNNLI